MDSQVLDARGLACPVPVVNTKKLLESIGEGSVTTIVDSDAAKENLLALAQGMGCEVDVQRVMSFTFRLQKGRLHCKNRSMISGIQLSMCQQLRWGGGAAN